MFRLSHTVDSVENSLHDPNATNLKKALDDVDSGKYLVPKVKTVSASERLRSRAEKSLADSKSARYRIVAQNRVSYHGVAIKVFDINNSEERQEHQDENTEDSSEPDFVYDVYVRGNSAIMDTRMGTIEIDDENDFWLPDEEDEEEPKDEYDSDSNGRTAFDGAWLTFVVDEDNWRNDYPDEEDSYNSSEGSGSEYGHEDEEEDVDDYY
ncbi:hypothetical protein HDU97_008565 [Phlyctochytrium planicorne]|nr:hypothetical protein HDU97_008565 [Phlyctochytrium planicorne]